MQTMKRRSQSRNCLALICAILMCLTLAFPAYAEEHEGNIIEENLIGSDLEPVLKYANENGIDISDLQIIEKITTVDDTASIDGGIVASPHTIYRFTNGGVLKGSSNAGITVPAKSTVVLEIPAGKTLEVYGGYNVQENRNMPAIRIPFGSTLVIQGGGRLVAHATNYSENRSAAAPAIGGAAGTPKLKSESCGDIYIIENTIVQADLPTNVPGLADDMGVCMGIDAGGIYNKDEALPFHGNVYVESADLIPNDTRPATFHLGHYTLLRDILEIKHNEEDKPYAVPYYFMDDTVEKGMTHLEKLSSSKVLSLSMRGMTGYYNRFCTGGRKLYVSLGPSIYGHTPDHTFSDGTYSIATTGGHWWYKICADNCTGFYFEVMNAIERVTDGCYIGDYKNYGRADMGNEDIFATIASTRALLKSKLMSFAPNKTSSELLNKLIDDWLYDEHWCDPFKHAGNTQPYDFDHTIDGPDDNLSVYGNVSFTVLNFDATQSLTISYQNKRGEMIKGGSCSSKIAYYYIKGKFTDSRGQYVQLDVTQGIGFDTSSWMASIPDEAYVNQINMPGTHDTGCFDVRCELFGRMIANTQTMNLYEQMKAGIRVFDIRLKSEKVADKENPENQFWVNHGGIACRNADGTDMYLNNVFDEAAHFLRDNPTETMIIFLNSEGDENDYYKQNYLYMREKLGLKIVDGKWTSNNMRQYAVPVIYVDSDAEGVESHIVPTLGQARGKVIVFHAKSMTKYEDHYNNVWPNEKIGFLGAAFSESENKIPQEYTKPGYFKNEGHLEVPDHMGDPNIRVIFSSQYYFAPLPNPLAQCREINDWVASYNFVRAKRYGWIMMNDPNAVEIRNIILSNQMTRMPILDHVHKWSFKVEPEDTITAICSEPLCPLKDGIAKVVLLTPDVVYDGKPYSYAAFVQSNSWERFISRLPNIQYQKLNADGSWSAATENEPKEPGHYRASGRFVPADTDGYTIYSEFNIISPVQFSVAGYKGEYDGNPHTVTVTSILPTSGVTYTYKYGNSVTTIPPTFVDGGKYSVEVVATAYGFSPSEPQTAVVEITKIPHSDEKQSSRLYNCVGARVMITPTYATPDNSRYSYDEWKCPSGISWYNDSVADTVVFIVKETQPAGSSFTVKRKVSSPSRKDYYQIFEIKMVEHNHKWLYSADGATLTALCCEPYCDLPGGKVSVRLLAPDASYTGRAYNRTNVEGLDAWNSAGAGGLVISYEGLAETPVIPGKYTAQLAPVSESSEKAKAKFEITRIDYPGDMDTWSELYNEEGFTTIVELPVLPTGGKYRMDQIKLPANLTGKEKSPTQLAVNVMNKIDPEESIQVQIPVQSMECYNDFVMTLTLYPVSHEHKWEYYNLEGDDAVLVAICTAERCTIPIQQGYHAVGVRVTAADKIYDGRPYEMSGIALENEEQWRAYGAGGINISLADAKAPVYPGTYTVNASPANDTSVIAYTTFTIKNSDWRGDTDFYGELFNVEGHTSEIYLPPLPVDGSYDIANMSGVPEGVTAQINKDGQLLLMAKRQLVNVDSFTVVIPVNTSRDFNSYTIKVHINVIDHEHKWKYNAEGNKLIAECVNPMFCSIPTTADGKHAIAVLLLAEDMQYNGQAYPKSNITLSGYEQWNSYAGIAPIIVDFTNGKAPVDVGEYTATATTGSGDNIATARANFNILPGAIVDITNVSGNALHARIQDSPAISALSPILVDEDYKTGAEIELVATELFDISKAEKELARSCMRTGEKVAAFVDLSMYKIVLGDEMKMSVLPNGAVTIAAEMPYPIRSRIEKLEVIGIHKGEAARLGAAYNKETGTVSFKTDRFSTYVFVYTQSKLPDTGDHANPEQWGIIALLTMIGIIILMRGRKQLG